MIMRTHIAFGVACITPIVGIENLPSITFVVVGAVVPDLDLKLKIKHRTLTHSLLGLDIMNRWIGSYSPDLAFYFLVGAVSHLFLDSLTVRGIALFYPFDIKFGIKLFKTESFADDCIFWLSILFIAFMVVTKFYPELLGFLTPFKEYFTPYYEYIRTFISGLF